VRRQSGSARRYADALFGLAVERDALDAWAGELQRIRAVAEDPTALRILAGPRVSLEQKRRVIESLAGPLSREVVSLTRILLERKRIELFPGVAEAFVDRLRAHRGIALAELTTAVELAESERRLIAERLEQRLGRSVEVEARVDPAIIGGVMARVGDQLFDASVRGKLESLRKRLVGARSG